MISRHKPVLCGKQPGPQEDPASKRKRIQKLKSELARLKQELAALLGPPAEVTESPELPG